jgi:hypothetical protein
LRVFFWILGHGDGGDRPARSLAGWLPFWVGTSLGAGSILCHAARNSSGIGGGLQGCVDVLLE